MLKDFSPRLYQQTILATALSHNTLVVLPTGMGKTAIAVMLAIARLRDYPESKILFLAPTRPLVQQHKDTFLAITGFPEKDYAVFTGMVPPAARKSQWEDAKIIFSTPQGLENDVINKNISLEKVSLTIFDEAHRAVGDYSYGFLAKQYIAASRYPRVLALTASPGSDEETILEVMKNLSIEKVEVRTEDDSDVKEYIQDVPVVQVKVELTPPFVKVIRHLSECYASKISGINELTKGAQNLSKTELLRLQSEIQGRLSHGERDFDLMRALSVIAEAMKALHALELAETQGMGPLVDYMGKLQEQAVTTKVKAVQNLVRDTNFMSAKILAEEAEREGVEHPKLPALLKIVKKELTAPNTKIIIFSQYRSQGEVIGRALFRENISSRIFVGQQKREGSGMSQKEQKKALEEFREGKFSCLVATSVAEEGLDIPKVDCVIFYEPVPSAIRTVQRRGRTGRLEKGKVFVLVAKGTRDEGYGWSAHHKEVRMLRMLKSFKTKGIIPRGFPKEEKDMPDQSRLDEFQGKVKVYTDYREKGSALMKELMELGSEVVLKRLDVGDYLLSERVCAEIKKVPDFVDSIIDGRLLSQIRDLRQYERPIVILEGEENIYSMRKIHPNAIRGMLSTIALAYSIPVIQTKNAKDSAALLYIIAKQEQFPTASYQFHSAKPLSLKEQQEFLVSALPGIGSILAKPLLKRFGSVRKVYDASEEELQKVDLIGPVKAKRIREAVDREYGKEG